MINGKIILVIFYHGGDLSLYDWFVILLFWGTLALNLSFGIAFLLYKLGKWLSNSNSAKSFFNLEE